MKFLTESTTRANHNHSSFDVKYLQIALLSNKTQILSKQCTYAQTMWFQYVSMISTANHLYYKKMPVACWQCWVAGFVKLCQRYFGLFAYLPQTPATLRWTAVSTKQHKHIHIYIYMYHPPILNSYNIYMYVHLLWCAFSITLDALPFP